MNNLDQKSHRVLVVDSAVDSADVLARLFQMSGHSAEVAYTGRGALLALAAEPFDLVLCEMAISDMTSTELGTKLRPHLSPGSQLIALTRCAAPEDADFVQPAGFDTHVGKPALFDTLIGLLPSRSRRMQLGAAIAPN